MVGIHIITIIIDFVFDNEYNFINKNPWFKF